MKTARYGLIALCLVLFSATSAPAQISIGIGLPNVSIGINIPLYPDLVPVPGYPVYYAPQVAANYFFYDGMYWIFHSDNWYASSWYNGPWGLVSPAYVPVFILRIPVRYYVRPPAYFRGWRYDAPPQWGRHWGPNWEQSRRGWDQWNRAYVPARAPLPVYQRQYKGDRYPRFEQQQSLHRQQYQHQPRNEKVRRIYQQHMKLKTPTVDQGRKVQQPPVRSQQQRDIRRSEPSRQIAPAQQRGPTVKEPQRPVAVQAPREQGRQQRQQDMEKQRGPGSGRSESGKKGGEGGRDRGK
jgi:hypothetical protein